VRASRLQQTDGPAYQPARPPAANPEIRLAATTDSIRITPPTDLQVATSAEHARARQQLQQLSSAVRSLPLSIRPSAGGAGRASE